MTPGEVILWALAILVVVIVAVMVVAIIIGVIGAVRKRAKATPKPPVHVVNNNYHQKG